MAQGARSRPWPRPRSAQARGLLPERHNASVLATHDVFISYSHKDKSTVVDLATRLVRRGIRVWIDEWEIQPGDSIPNRLEHGLDCCAALLFCMSTHSL